MLFQRNHRMCLWFSPLYASAFSTWAFLLRPLSASAYAWFLSHFSCSPPMTQIRRTWGKERMWRVIIASPSGSQFLLFLTASSTCWMLQVSVLASFCHFFSPIDGTSVNFSSWLHVYSVYIRWRDGVCLCCWCACIHLQGRIVSVVEAWNLASVSPCVRISQS